MSAATFVQWDITDGDNPTLVYWAACREHGWCMGETQTDAEAAREDARDHQRRYHGTDSAIPLPCTGDDQCRGTEHIEGCYAVGRESHDSEKSN